MPRSATFTVTAAGSHSSAHNSREEKPKYLIGTLPGQKNDYDLRHSDSDFLVLAEAKYKETTGQKMQAKQKDALIKETVLSLEAHHTAEDVQKVFDELAAKYGGHYITELSIHRDEGHFEDENGITYYPTKDILQKEDGWYIVPLAESITHAPDYRPKAEEFSEKVDIDRFKPIHNVHAHVKFSMFDLNTGKTGRMQHKDLNDRIRTAARVLKLEYNPEKKNDKRVTVADKKAQHKAVRNEKVRNFLEHGHTLEAKNREAEQLRYNFREIQKRITALEGIDAEQKKELHRLNTEIKKLEAEGVDKDAKIASLEAKLTEAAKVPHEPINASLIVKLQDEVKLLQLTNKGLEIELEKTKSATVPEPAKAENAASRAVEGYLETLPKSPGVQVKTTDLEEVSFYSQAGEKAAKYSRGEEFAAELVKKHTNFVGKVDKDALIAELGQEFKQSSGIMYKGLSIVEDFKRGYDNAKRGFSDALKRTETALKDVFGKITGKSLSEVQNERREQERAQRAELVKQKEAEQPFELKRPSRGLSLGR